MILDIRGSQAAKKVIQLATPLQTQNTVQLTYFRFPPMPLVPQFEDAITCSGQTFNVDPQTSLAGLAKLLLANNRAVFLLIVKRLILRSPKNWQLI